jgi:hypothetical protein
MIKKNDGWHKSELMLHNKGMRSLAVAVLKQWQLDGKPKGDSESIRLWADLLKAHKNPAV